MQFPNINLWALNTLKYLCLTIGEDTLYKPFETGAEYINDTNIYITIPHKESAV